MEQISQQLPQVQPIASTTSRSSHWLIIAAVIVILLFLGGAGYYYFEIYRPAQYAKEVISLFDNLDKEIQTSQNQTLKDSKDYQGAIRILQNQQTFLGTSRDKLNSLKPPRRMQQLHQDFQKALGLLISASSDAQKITSFIIQADKLYDILKPKDEPKDKTVGEFVKFWGDRTAQAKIVASDLFQEKPPKAEMLQFDKLKSTWQETVEGYEAALEYLKGQDPNILVSNVSDNNIPEAERAKIKKIDKIDDFLPMLEDVVREDAESLIKFSVITTLAGDELNTLGSKVEKGIKELKEKYQ